MNKNNISYFIAVFIVIFLFVGGYRYYQYILEKNFILEIDTVCDSNTEKCFSPSTDMSFLDAPYKKVKIIASLAPKCLEEHNCETFYCPTGMEDTNKCQITYCSNETKIDGEECLDNK
jgi:hypothetical protein